MPNGWATEASMPTARDALAIGVVEGIVYASGGCDGSHTALANVEAFDPATNSWTTRSSIPTARSFLGVGVVSGVILAVEPA
jgi:hypothetical protein